MMARQLLTVSALFLGLSTGACGQSGGSDDTSQDPPDMGTAEDLVLADQPGDDGPDPGVPDAVDVVDLLPKDLPDHAGDPGNAEDITACEEGELESCEVRFRLRGGATAPGESAWLEVLAGGESLDKLPMSLDPDGLFWFVDVPLQDVSLFEYVFRVGTGQDSAPVDQNGNTWLGNLVLWVDCGFQNCGDSEFIARPRLHWPGSDGFILMAETTGNLPLDIHLEWEGGSSEQQSMPFKGLSPSAVPTLQPNGFLHEVFLAFPSGVQEMTYRIDGTPSAGPVTVRNPHLGGELAMVVYGDTRTHPEDHQMVADRIAEADPDVVLHLGDNVTSGVDLTQWYVEFLDIIDVYAPGSFYYPVVGNHEISGGLGQGFFELFFHTRNIHVMEGNYWADLGLVGLIAVEDYVADFTDPAALAWFETALQALQDKPWLFVSMHVPMYTFNGHSPWLAGREVLQPLMETYGVDAVFAGHQHCYEHFVVNDIHYVTSGGGGAPLNKNPTDVGPPEEQAYFQAAGGFFHFVSLDITSESIKVDVIRADDGTVADNWTMTAPQQD